ncbi:acyltransferase family protein [Notoacmeibacter ruber]|uniref:Acyltransferase n=1 Tax=Notoacmeibacter ruber TaxID=2670375 RepID=A0A3L7JCH3_9HYPH|nr:acyltransferase family protein [Notoacmeibacter ruber]RLQ88447.1 acyltransferase [Notoacmeibacter ruber]
MSTTGPVQIGRISYSLYLWHWPVFVIWKSSVGSWGAVDICGALLLTICLSVLGFIFIEKPVRYSPRLVSRKYTSVGVALLSTAVLVIGLVQVKQDIEQINIIYLSDGSSIFSREVRYDLPAISTGERRCHLSSEIVEYPPCEFGTASSDRRMVLFGDSHAAQWFPVLKEIAEDQGFKLLARTKTNCFPNDIRLWHDQLKRQYFECDEWREAVLAEIERLKPDVVFMSAYSRHHVVDDKGQTLKGTARLEALASGEERILERILQTGARVVFFADTPRMDIDPLDCLVSNPLRSDMCTTPRSLALAKRSPWSVSDQKPRPDVAVIDMTDNFCWDDVCRAASSNFVMMRDAHHIAVKYSLTLRPEVERKIAQIFGDIFVRPRDETAVLRD